MHALLRRVATRRSLFLQYCELCTTANPQVSSGNTRYDAVSQTNSSTESCRTSKQLGMRISATHEKLRSGLQQGRTFEEVWAEHSCNEEGLTEYASSMCSIAEHWEGKDVSLKHRNTWVEAEVRRYYYRRHNLMDLQEEVKRAMLDPTLLTPHQAASSRKLQSTLNALWKQLMHEDCSYLHDKAEASGVVGSCENANSPTSGTSSMPQAFVYSEDSCDAGQLCATSRVRVLDVGSCYNPLAQFPHLHVTPLDLMPATPDVYKCDFINVKIADASECSELLEEEDNRADRRIDCLPRNYYDVVVFSLVLDYIPCPEARLQCCRKAYQLLRPGGLMLIVAPSSASGAHSKLLMKWKQLNLARLGFGRLMKTSKDNYMTFSYRKGFFQSFWCIYEAKKVEMDVKNLASLTASYLPNRHSEYKIERIDFKSGLYFGIDFEYFNS